MSSELDVFVGEWAVEIVPPGSPPAGGARSTFEWILDGAFLQQRTQVPIEGAPDSRSIVVAEGEPGRYVQHYYDARGVVRLYTMTFTAKTWTLTRESADFSPFDFAQRFIGTFTADDDRIDGRWEMARPGADWELDFAMNYTRLI